MTLSRQGFFFTFGACHHQVIRSSPSAILLKYISFLGLFSAETYIFDQLKKYDFLTWSRFVNSLRYYLPWYNSNGVALCPAWILNWNSFNALFTISLKQKNLLRWPYLISRKFEWLFLPSLFLNVFSLWNISGKLRIQKIVCTLGHWMLPLCPIYFFPVFLVNWKNCSGIFWLHLLQWFLDFYRQLFTKSVLLHFGFLWTFYHCLVFRWNGFVIPDRVRYCS